MSLLKKVGKFVGRAVSKVGPVASLLPGPVGIAAGTLGGLFGKSRVPSTVSALPFMPAAGAIGRAVIPRIAPGIGAIGRAVTRAGGVRGISRSVAKQAGYLIVGGLVYDAAGNLVGPATKRRRINPLNHRALGRAMRRVCAAKNICERVERIASGKTKRKRAC